MITRSSQKVGWEERGHDDDHVQERDREQNLEDALADDVESAAEVSL